MADKSRQILLSKPALSQIFAFVHKANFIGLFVKLTGFLRHGYPPAREVLRPFGCALVTAERAAAGQDKLAYVVCRKKNNMATEDTESTELGFQFGFDGFGDGDW